MRGEVAEKRTFPADQRYDGLVIVRQRITQIQIFRLCCIALILLVPQDLLDRMCTYTPVATLAGHPECFHIFHAKYI